jgi:rhodanese-related sulfurtransferase
MPLTIAVVAAVIAVAIYFCIRNNREEQRRTDLHIDVSDLNDRIAKGERLTIVDLRHPLDVLASPQVIPGATHIDPAEVDQRVSEISPDANVILYCTCPNEETSMKVLDQLKHRGFRQVKALKGGLPRWKEAGFPVQELYPELQEQIQRQNVRS